MITPGPDKPKLSVIEGGGEPSAKKESFLEQARRMVREALGEPKAERYDHLSVVPPLPEETSHPAVAGTGALSPTPSVEGERIDSALHHMAQDARAKLEVIHSMGPEDIGPQDPLLQ